MQEFVTRLVSQTREFWSNLDSRQRIIAGVAAGVTFLGLVALIFMANRPVWTTLGNFDLEDAAAIRNELTDAGYTVGDQFRITETAGTARIDVDARIRDEVSLTLAEKGLFGQRERGYAIFDDFDITTTDLEQRVNIMRANTSIMRRMIRTYEQIEDVEINAPFIEEQSIFRDEEIDRTVTAVLTLKPGTSLTDEQIRAIRNVISGGFPGVDDENVVITDQFMRELIPEEMEEGAITSRQQRVVRETERGLENNIRAVLGPVLGRDKFTVAVNIEFDWDAVTINSVEHDIPGFEQLVESRQTENETLEGEGVRPGGEPGVTSNTPPFYSAQSNVGPVRYTRNEEVVNLLTNMTQTERVQSPYAKRITAAVAVDGKWIAQTDTDGNVSRTYQPRTREELDAITVLVRTAIGENPDRQDVIEVREIPWDRTREFELADARRLTEEFNRKLMIFAVAVIPIILFMFLLYAAWKRRQRLKEEELARQRELERQRAIAAAEAGIAGEVTLEDQERMEIQRRAQSIARAKPQVVAELVRTWLYEEAA